MALKSTGMQKMLNGFLRYRAKLRNELLDDFKMVADHPDVSEIHRMLHYVGLLIQYFFLFFLSHNQFLLHVLIVAFCRLGSFKLHLVM